jgi:CheY-like chemotaxis protein
MSASKHPAPRAAGLRVLLVEDESMVALLLEAMLAELGHEVV